MQILSKEELKRDILNSFRRIVESSIDNECIGGCHEFCNDIGTITDITPADDGSDSYSFGMSIVADRVQYSVAIRPGWVARFGSLYLQRDDDGKRTIQCGDSRVLYLFWRMCIEYWHETIAIERATKKHLREHPDESDKSWELWSRLSKEYAPKRHARLRAAIPTKEDAIAWLACQGLSFACRPADEYWELHFYPWWGLVTAGKIK